jgi:anaerobic selenocysteine-containing dehydrogenase
VITAQQTANQWRPTACILCYVNCGLEVETDGRKITRVRGDRANARSQGYLCQKPQRLHWYGDHADRLTTPLRRRPEGAHEPISWETAFTEIAARLNALRSKHGGEAFAFYGGGGQGNHLGGSYFFALRDALGATKYFNALSQEKTGDFWVNGRLFGDQRCHTAEDIEDTDLLVVLGCNPWLANGFQVPAREAPRRQDSSRRTRAARLARVRTAWVAASSTAHV